MRHRLHVVQEKEASIQRHLESWTDSAAYRAGAPSWMQGLEFDCRFARRALKGDENLMPDGLATDGKRNYVVELKRGGKETHAALAQALYYAETLPKQAIGDVTKCWTRDASIVPVVVTPWHSWLRHAINWLRKHEVSNDVLHAVEYVELKRGGRSQSYFWFEESDVPLAVSKRKKPPMECDDRGAPWVQDQQTGVFYSLPNGAESPNDIPDADARWVVAPLGGKSREWLIWRGSMNDTGRYWLESA